MNKIKESQRVGVFEFDCLGCGHLHTFNTDPTYSPIFWDFNKDIESPTVRPSLKFTGPYPDGVHICHSYITNGQIEYLEDCTHKLAGQTIELPEINKIKL